MSGGSSSGLLAETVERLLSERCGPDVCQEAEATGWAPDLWVALATAGLTPIRDRHRCSSRCWPSRS
jgi:hypothetical protein